MAYKFTVVGMKPHPLGLELRLAYGPEGATWVQFASAVVPLDDLHDYMRGYISRRLFGPDTVQQPDEPLF